MLLKLLLDVPLCFPKTEELPGNPSSLIQNKKCQTERIKYGNQTSQTLATMAARSQTSMLFKRYLAMWLAKMWNGSALGMSAA